VRPQRHTFVTPICADMWGHGLSPEWLLVLSRVAAVASSGAPVRPFRISLQRFAPGRPLAPAQSLLRCCPSRPRPLLPCTLGSIPTAARSQRHARQARRIRRGGKCGDGVVGLGLRPSSSHAGLSATFSRHAGHHRRRRVDPGWLCPDPAWHTGIRQARDGFDVSVDPAGCVRYDVPRDEAIVRVVTRYFFFI